MSKATTKFAIAFAFKELLLEKSIDKITINDITEKCGINRQTFYYHFHDIYELIEWICETDADHVLKQNKTYDTWQEGFLAIFHLLKKDEPFVVNIYHNAPRGYIYRYLYKVTYQLIYDVLEEKAAGMVVREEDKTFIADFYKYGFVGLVLEWIDKGMKEDPKQIIEIRNLITELSKNHTILLSSHIMQEVSAVCNQIIIINQGQLILYDKPENISNHIAQTNDLTLTIKGNKDLIKSIIDSFEEVIESRILGTDTKEVYQVELSTSIEEDIREALFYKLADAKCPILELNHKVPTLEEVFLRLTGEGTKQYGGKMSKEEKKKMRQKLAKREETVEKEVAEKEVENTEDRAEQMEEKEEQ